MAERRLNCPLCGLEFAPADTLCRHGCPLRSTCGLTRCPSCDYEFPTERPRTWLERLLGPPAERGEAYCDHLAPALALAPGERARVARLLGSPQRCNRLAVFGLVPGAEIRCLQRRPAFVLRVGETELALDPEIARLIVVERPAQERTAEPAQGPARERTGRAG